MRKRWLFLTLIFTLVLGSSFGCDSSGNGLLSAASFFEIEEPFIYRRIYSDENHIFVLTSTTPRESSGAFVLNKLDAASRATLWRTPIEVGELSLEQTLKIGKEVIYFRDNFNSIVALSKSSGDKLWSFSNGKFVIAEFNETTVVVDQNWNLALLAKENGKVITQTAIRCSYAASAVPYGDHLLVLDGGSLSSYDINQQSLYWKIDYELEVSDPTSEMSFVDGKLIVRMGKVLLRLNVQTGAEIWKQKLDEGRFPTVNGDELLLWNNKDVGTSDVVFLNANNGEIRRSITIKASLSADQALFVINGILFKQSSSNHFSNLSPFGLSNDDEQASSNDYFLELFDIESGRHLKTLGKYWGSASSNAVVVQDKVVFGVSKTDWKDHSLLAIFQIENSTQP